MLNITCEGRQDDVPKINLNIGGCVDIVSQGDWLIIVTMVQWQYSDCYNEHKEEFVRYMPRIINF